MHPLIPPEIISTAAQMVIYFFTVAAALVSFMAMARA